MFFGLRVGERENEIILMILKFRIKSVQIDMLLYMFLFIGFDKLVVKKVCKCYVVWKYLLNDGMLLIYYLID